MDDKNINGSPNNQYGNSYQSDEKFYTPNNTSNQFDYDTVSEEDERDWDNLYDHQGNAYNNDMNNVGNMPIPNHKPQENARGWSSINSDIDDWDSVTQAQRSQPSGNMNAAAPAVKTPFKKRKRASLPAERDTFKENVITITIAIVIAMIVRTLWVEPFTIPSGSMLPSLQIGDYVFVDKQSYGYSRYSLPFGIPVIKGRIRYHEPELGDVVVFKLPSDTSINYIKRIMGLPGDTVQTFNGRLFINGKMLNREEVGRDFIAVEGGKFLPVVEYKETLPNGVEHSIFEVSDNEKFDNTQPIHVPAGFILAMGDNRDNSLDSRSDEVGLIPIQNLVGKARYVFFSKTPEFSWFKIWKWLENIRTDRIGMEVE